MRKHLKISLTLLLLSSTLCGQSLSNNGSIISIKSNTIFSIGENATNNGTIINNGSFLIAGAWQNNGTYDAGTGDFTLNSPGDQIVNHNAQAFERLIIRGGGNKIFQADITINDGLTLQDGVMLSQNGARLYIAPGASVTGGTASSYIAGPLFITGSENLFYPIGTNDQYLPVSLSNLSTFEGTIGFEALTPNPISLFNDIDAVIENYAWLMTVDNGSISGGNITLPLINSSVNADIADAVVVESASLQDNYLNLGQLSTSGNAIEGEVTSMNAPTGPYFSIGFTSVESMPNGAISVINAITPATQDGKHDFLKIENIEQYPNNRVSIYNRWGDLIFEATGYNNNDVIFTGISNNGSSREIDEGTYYYAIEAGGETISGFFVIRR